VQESNLPLAAMLSVVLHWTGQHHRQFPQIPSGGIATAVHLRTKLPASLHWEVMSPVLHGPSGREQTNLLSCQWCGPDLNRRDQECYLPLAPSVDGSCRS